MGKTRNTGFSNNAIQYNSGSIAFTSGSTTLLNISSSGAIVTTGTITANTLVVQTVTSSVSFVTGSTKFGVLSSNTHQFTGSLYITGGINLNSGSLLVGTNSPIWTNGTTRGVVEINGPSQALLGFDVAGSGAGYIYHDGTNMTMNNGLNGYLRLLTNGAEVMRITGSNMGIGTTNISTEANLYLGAQSTSEGGQLVLQKGTSYASASHLDNYQDRFRIMRGNDTTSTAELFSISMTSGVLTANSYATITGGTFDIPASTAKTVTVAFNGGNIHAFLGFSSQSGGITGAGSKSIFLGGTTNDGAGHTPTVLSTFSYGDQVVGASTSNTSAGFTFTITNNKASAVTWTWSAFGSFGSISVT